MAVRSFGMGVKIPPNIVDRDKVGEGMVESCFHLTPILSQLWLKVGETDLGIDLFLRLPRDASFSSKDPILINLEPFFDSQRSDRNVVGFGTREILKGSPIAFLRDYTQVDLETGAKHDRCSGCSFRDDFFHFLIGHKAIHD